MCLKNRVRPADVVLPDDNWKEVAMMPAGGGPLWRLHSDAVNMMLLAGWLPETRVARLLKTDLFDEAATDGLLPLLRQRAHRIVGTDISPPTAKAAAERSLAVDGIAADVRQLPFSDAAFDVIVSNSTLDHFESASDLRAALAELQRVLRPGGELLITMDNLANPVLALRHALPFRLLNRLGLVPYYVGVSCGPRDLRQMLLAAGFEVIELRAVMHCQRVLCVALAGLVQKYLPIAAQRIFLRGAMAFEWLSVLPTRFLTGHFVAARAVKAAEASRPGLHS